MKCPHCQQDKEFSEFSEIRSVCNDCHFEIESAYFEDTYSNDEPLHCAGCNSPLSDLFADCPVCDKD